MYFQGSEKIMKILSINAGSSSLKFTLFEMPEKLEIASGNFEKIGLEDSFYTIKYNGEKIGKEILVKDHEVAVSKLIDELIEMKIISSLDDIDGIGHRVVHGKDKYFDSVLISDEVLEDIKSYSDLAPLHNPANILGIKAFMEVLPSVKNVAVFDTAFHQTIDKTKYIYPTPYSWYENYGIRKYGFHGTSHKYITKYLTEHMGRSDLKIINCHLGNGGSLCAVDKGKSINTTMGFSPLSGIPMGTRSGDIDPSIIPYIMSKTNMSLESVFNELNKKSGLLGMSGISHDSRDIFSGIENGNERCQLAEDIFASRIASFIGSYYVELGGADVISFTGGIGENAKEARRDIMKHLEVLGIKLDETRNDVRGKFTLISTDDSKVECYIVPTNEELMIAIDAYDLIK